MKEEITTRAKWVVVLVFILSVLVGGCFSARGEFMPFISGALYIGFCLWVSSTIGDKK